jgi:predicted N-acyltransferase
VFYTTKTSTLWFLFFQDDEHVALEDRKGPLREWIVLDANRREIARRYRTFLRTYVDRHGRNIYAERIKAMCAGINFLTQTTKRIRNKTLCLNQFNFQQQPVDKFQQIIH